MQLSVYVLACVNIHVFPSSAYCEDLGVCTHLALGIGSLGKWLILGLGQGYYNKRLECIVVSEIKEALKESWKHEKKTQKSA